MSGLPLEETVYSRPFNRLRSLGAWVPESDDPAKVNNYVIFKTAITVAAAVACVSLSADFYSSLGDYKDMTWNMCVNALFTGSLMKNLYVTHRSNLINSLRRRLHKRATSRETPEDELLNRSSEREMEFIYSLFYWTCVLLAPIWLISWYLSNPRSIPVPFHIPMDLDLEDDLQYNIIFFAVAVLGLGGISFVVQNELAMFTILIQISREYKRLLKDLKKIKELYEDDGTGAGEQNKHKPEVNPWLRKLKTKSLVQEYSTHQQELIEYTIDFENCYSYSMVLQVLVMIVLVIVIAMLCILLRAAPACNTESLESTCVNMVQDYGSLWMSLSYQIGYICIVLLDMYLLCWLCARISGQCLKVGREVYAASWYQMSADIRRDLCMIIMRSQRPPKITSGKLIELNLHAYMMMLRNIYSWLALFQHLAFKSN